MIQIMFRLHSLLLRQRYLSLLLLFTLFSIVCNAQNQIIKIHKGNVTVAKVIRTIERQTPFSVDYGEHSLNLKSTVRIDQSQYALSALLDKVLAHTDLKYKFVDRHILISKADKPRNKPHTSVQPAALRRINGTVVDEKGEPLIGVSVTLVGVRSGVATDVNGRFTINVPSEAVLQFSYVGMTSRTLKIGVSSALKVVMHEDNSLIHEVVVTGMSKMDKRLFTGATTKLLADNIRINGLADISRSLEGRVAGMSVQNITGTFGTAPKIRIRGATSIFGNSKPLWVVDGVIVDDIAELSADQLSSGDAITLISSAIAGLNADDIESFQVLKDGAATSIYGARAMPGVIVVTTKKGKEGNPHFGYTGEFTTRLIPSYSNFNIMNSQEQMGVYKEMKDKGWLNYADTFDAQDSGVYGKMYQLMSTYDDATQSFLLENSTSAINNYLRQAEYRNTNWFSELFSTAIMQQHSVNVSMGSDKASLYGSIGVMTDPGWYKDSKVNRYTANMNAGFNLSKALSLHFISSTTYRKQKAPGTLSRTVDPLYGDIKRDFDINPYSYALNSSRTLDSQAFYTRNYAKFNISHELDNNYINIDMVDLKFQAALKYKPVKDLEFELLGAVKYANTSQEHIIKDDSNQALAYRAMSDATVRNNNPWLYTDPDNVYSLPVSILPEGGIYQKTDYKMNGYDLRATFTWNHLFNDTHIFNLFGGMELNAVNRNHTYFNGWGMQYSLGETPFYTYQFFKKSIEEGSDYYSLSNTRVRSSAFFTNLTYSYKGRYTMNATYRYEGTNRLGKSNKARWLPTWNISGAWNVHEEDFFTSCQPVLSHLALKASYSLTADPGPASITNSSVLLNSYKPYRPSSDLQESGLIIVDLANDNLTYEKKHELNIGTDIGLLDNRINVTADWYSRHNYDLIGIAQTEGAGGQIRKLANVASMHSSGFELAISSKNIVKSDFDWTTDFIFSKMKSKVTKLAPSATAVYMVSGAGFTTEGYPVRSLFSFRYAGLNSDGLPMIVNQDGVTTSKGSQINFQSQNFGNLVYEGSTDPTVVGSLGNTFRYKGFRLQVYLTYSMGNKLRLDPVFSSSYSDLTAMPKEFKNRWVMAGDEQKTDVPVIITRSQYENDNYIKTLYNAYNYSTARVVKGDFIRMKEISLSYDFPARWIRTWGVSDMSLKLQATNLFLLYADSKLNGQDPEFFRSGGVAAPVPKQFTLTLRLGI